METTEEKKTCLPHRFPGPNEEHVWCSVSINLPFCTRNVVLNSPFRASVARVLASWCPALLLRTRDDVPNALLLLLPLNDDPCRVAHARQLTVFKFLPALCRLEKWRMAQAMMQEDKEDKSTWIYRGVGSCLYLHMYVCMYAHIGRTRTRMAT